MDNHSSAQSLEINNPEKSGSSIQKKSNSSQVDHNKTSSDQIALEQSPKTNAVQEDIGHLLASTHSDRANDELPSPEQGTKTGQTNSVEAQNITEENYNNSAERIFVEKSTTTGVSEDCNGSPSDARKDDQTSEELNTWTTEIGPFTAESSSALCDIADTLKDLSVTTVLGNLQKCTEDGFLEIKKLLTDLVIQSKQTNIHLQALVQEMTSRTTTTDKVNRSNTAELESLPQFPVALDVNVYHAHNPNGFSFGGDSKDQYNTATYRINKTGQGSKDFHMVGQKKDCPDDLENLTGKVQDPLEHLCTRPIKRSGRVTQSSSDHSDGSLDCFAPTGTDKLKTNQSQSPEKETAKAHQRNGQISELRERNSRQNTESLSNGDHVQDSSASDAAESERSPQNAAGKKYLKELDDSASREAHIAKTLMQKTQPCSSPEEMLVQNLAPNITCDELRPGNECSKEDAASSATVTPVKSNGRIGGKKPTSKERDRVSALGLNIESSSGIESQRLYDALERAQAPDPDPSPKARSFDTVLCLDTSESMFNGGAYEQMINIAHTFINGIEDMCNEVEENIGLVTFGGYSNISQHLTIDFARIRDAIDRIEVRGKSPFFEAIVVCLAAFNGKGGTVSISGEYDVPPRIIFITDGHITECSDEPFGPDRVIDITNARARFCRLMMDLNPKKHSSMPHPIVFIPVGTSADTNFLKSMATLSDGLFVEPENIRSLCKYFRVQDIIGKVLACMQSKKTDCSDDRIRAVVQALVVPTMDEKDMAEVVMTVKNELQNPNRQRRRDSKPTDYDEVFEDKEGVMSGDRLALGTRVVRGPDWRWGDQDGGIGRAGTVVQHENMKNPFTWVLWDTGDWNRYAYGSDMGYQIWKADEQPLLRQADRQLLIGMTVQRGPNWHDSNFAGGEPGVIIRKSKDGGQIKVRWKNGEIQECATNTVEFSDPFDPGCHTDRKRTEDLSLGEELFGHNLDQEEEDGKVPVWQWQDDHSHWRVYSEQQNDSLERAYNRKSDKTCVIERNGKNFRVTFRRMMEKDTNSGTERRVKRSWFPLDEYQSLLLAQKLTPQA